MDPNPNPPCLFLGCARITSPMTSVWQDGKMGHAATNLVSVILPEWRSSEKQDKRRDGDIAFPAQSSVSHFSRQQKRSLAVHSSPNLGSLCSSMITKRGVNWPFCLRQVAEWHVWFILRTSLCLDAERRRLCLHHLWTEELLRVDFKYSNCVLMLRIKAGLNDSHIMMRKQRGTLVVKCLIVGPASVSWSLFSLWDVCALFKLPRRWLLISLRVQTSVQLYNIKLQSCKHLYTFPI